MRLIGEANGSTLPLPLRTVAMDAAGLEFRATKDLDIVLCVEALDATFVTAFWTFVDSGGYVSDDRTPAIAGVFVFCLPLLVRTLMVIRCQLRTA